MPYTLTGYKILRNFPFGSCKVQGGTLYYIKVKKTHGVSYADRRHIYRN